MLTLVWRNPLIRHPKLLGPLSWELMVQQLAIRHFYEFENGRLASGTNLIRAKFLPVMQLMSLLVSLWQPLTFPP